MRPVINQEIKTNQIFTFRYKKVLIRDKREVLLHPIPFLWNRSWTRSSNDNDIVIDRQFADLFNRILIKNVKLFVKAWSAKERFLCAFRMPNAA
ncbi:hypothetical protein D3C77_558710 [compost metagenome]